MLSKENTHMFIVLFNDNSNVLDNWRPVTHSNGHAHAYQHMEDAGRLQNVLQDEARASGRTIAYKVERLYRDMPSLDDTLATPMLLRGEKRGEKKGLLSVLKMIFPNACAPEGTKEDIEKFVRTHINSLVADKNAALGARDEAIRARDKETLRVEDAQKRTASYEKGHTEARVQRDKLAYEMTDLQASFDGLVRRVDDEVRRSALVIEQQVVGSTSWSRASAGIAALGDALRIERTKKNSDLLLSENENLRAANRRIADSRHEWEQHTNALLAGYEKIATVLGVNIEKPHDVPQHPLTRASILMKAISEKLQARQCPEKSDERAQCDLTVAALRDREAEVKKLKTAVAGLGDEVGRLKNKLSAGGQIVVAVDKVYEAAYPSEKHIVSGVLQKLAQLVTHNRMQHERLGLARDDAKSLRERNAKLQAALNNLSDAYRRLSMDIGVVPPPPAVTEKAAVVTEKVDGTNVEPVEIGSVTPGTVVRRWVEQGIVLDIVEIGSVTPGTVVRRWVEGVPEKHRSDVPKTLYMVLDGKQIEKLLHPGPMRRYHPHLVYLTDGRGHVIPMGRKVKMVRTAYSDFHAQMTLPKTAPGTPLIFYAQKNRAGSPHQYGRAMDLAGPSLFDSEFVREFNEAARTTDEQFAQQFGSNEKKS
jgi:hypothetical protein